MSVYERVKAQLCRPGRRQDADQGRDRRHARRRSIRIRSYVEGADFDQLKTTTDGNYGGLGLTVSMEDGAVKVIAPTEDTPGVARRDQVRRLHHPHQRRADLRRHARRSGREDARRAGHADQADHRPPGPRQAVRRHHGPRADRAPPGQVGDQGRRRLHQHQHLLGQRRRADRRRRCSRSTRPPAAIRSAMSSTCAPTPAACSTRRSTSPTTSSTAARSSRSAAARRTISSAITRGRATWPMACR